MSPTPSRRGDGSKGLTRRALLGAAAGTGLVAASGCLGVITGNKPVSFSSTEATVEGSAASDAGYELTGEQAPTVKRSFSVAGQTRDVQVTNHVAMYEKSVDLAILGKAKAAVFALVTTPQVDIAGKTFNPVGDMSTEQLLEQFQSQYDSFSVGSKVGSTDVRTLGTTTTVDEYEGKAKFQGNEVPVYIHITRVKQGGDFVIPLGIYPQKLSGEAKNVRTLIEHIQH